MNPYWQGLLANFAVVALFLSIWTHALGPLGRLGPETRSVATGLLGGFGAVAAMLLPVSLVPGLIVDLRMTPLGLAGLFGGPVAGAVAAVVAGSWRWMEGGIGALPGVMGIVASVLAGIVIHAFARGRQRHGGDVMLLAASISAIGLGSLLALPDPVRTTVMAAIGLQSTLLLLVATAVAGLALLADERRVAALEANALYRAITEALPDCLNAKDLEGRFIAANPATADLMGAPSAEALIGRTDHDFYPPSTAERFRADEVEVLEDGVPLTVEQAVEHRDGRTGWLATLKAPLRDSGGAVVGLITHNRDITDRKRLENDLAASRSRLDAALAHMADGLAMYSPDGELLLCNEQYRALFPLTADLRVPGRNLRDILRAAIERGEETTISPESIEGWIEQVVLSLREPGERPIRLRDGRWLEARTRQATDGTCLVVFSDITQQKQAEAALLETNRQLEAMAQTDALTGLFNRRAFDGALEREVARAVRDGGTAALLLIDVDRFKAFNDRYGHQAGDDCLRAVAQAIQGTLRRPGDLAARYGGEEIAAILPGCDLGGALHVAQAMRLAVRDLAIDHEDGEGGLLSLSIGVAVTGQPEYVRPLELIARADKALYAAKNGGRDQVRAWREPPAASAGG